MGLTSAMDGHRTPPLAFPLTSPICSTSCPTPSDTQENGGQDPSRTQRSGGDHADRQDIEQQGGGVVEQASPFLDLAQAVRRVDLRSGRCRTLLLRMYANFSLTSPFKSRDSPARGLRAHTHRSNVSEYVGVFYVRQKWHPSPGHHPPVASEEQGPLLNGPSNERFTLPWCPQRLPPVGLGLRDGVPPEEIFLQFCW
ncbi:hypothetical protein SAMN00790413_04948 [Deinococcus hopiensis KR-140]|uniref:Uncharacterized protein n=1 Tax=Deinococcus hopiensis KR-140 TaxID=695939 RepID=A0A1W1US79_9DEIO|nr:hypothetical protein SAMN00790413_04948 [Deinococcus hopiensis KR-140]